MSATDTATPLLKQHLIDPELCIRCGTCEATCTQGAVSHDDVNYVVAADKCNFCMDCIAPCPTGSIDNWRLVAAPYGPAYGTWGDFRPRRTSRRARRKTGRWQMLCAKRSAPAAMWRVERPPGPGPTIKRMTLEKCYSTFSVSCTECVSPGALPVTVMV